MVIIRLIVSVPEQRRKVNMVAATTTRTASSSDTAGSSIPCHTGVGKISLGLITTVMIVHYVGLFIVTTYPSLRFHIYFVFTKQSYVITFKICFQSAPQPISF